jgi:hypothetical protein
MRAGAQARKIDPPATAPVVNGLLQRKCACGGAPGADGECAGCREKRLQRKAASGRQAPDVPPAVHEVLRSPGKPLEEGDRLFMESRFGHDFSQVRIHTDSRAMESAKSVGAFAYTVGTDIVFGGGRYEPATREGRRLLAHELTHTIQQRGESRPQAKLEVASADSAAEREADAAAARVSEGQPFNVGFSTGPVIARDDPDAGASGSRADQVECVKRLGGCASTRPGGLPTEQEIEEYNRRCREETGYSGPSVTPTNEECAGQSGSQPTVPAPQEEEPLNKVGRALTEPERQTAAQAAQVEVPAAGSGAGTAAAVVQGARFVVHDTASLVSAARIAEVARLGRRSTGEGAAAYVPQTGNAGITQQTFFGPRRPTATEFEKGQDIMAEATRYAEFRNVWQAADRTQREAALDGVLTAQGSPSREAARERSMAIAELNATSGKVHSAATWAVEDLCGTVSSQGAAAVAASTATVPALEGGCNRLANLFSTRASRIASTVNVEIVQERGSDCRTTGTLTPLTPYTDSQYMNVKQLYLRAALQAGAFPEVTTHFWIDKGIGDHCDPRCFNLGRLYDEIQTAMGHRAGSTYGITPSYGTGATHNVWWHPTVCGGPHP